MNPKLDKNLLAVKLNHDIIFTMPTSFSWVKRKIAAGEIVKPGPVSASAGGLYFRYSQEKQQ